MTARRRTRLGVICWIIDQWIREQLWALRVIATSVWRDGLSRTAMLIDVWTSVKVGAPTEERGLVVLNEDGDVSRALFHWFGNDWCWNTPESLYYCQEDGTPLDKEWCITHWMNMPDDFEELAPGCVVEHKCAEVEALEQRINALMTGECVF